MLDQWRGKGECNLEPGKILHWSQAICNVHVRKALAGIYKMELNTHGGHHFEVVRIHATVCTVCPGVDVSNPTGVMGPQPWIKILIQRIISRTQGLTLRAGG